MRKGLLAALTSVLALTVAVGVAPAATLNPSQVGTTSACGGTWHFVNNQTGGAAAGSLTATFSVNGSTVVVTVPASTVNPSNQQFNVVLAGPATLLSATSTLPGRLVLSDAPTCEEPPPCDPKVDPKCEEPPPPPCDPKDPKCT